MIFSKQSLRQPLTVVATVVLALSSNAAVAQPYLSLDEAIAKALAYNYDIRLAKSAAEIAAANNTAGAAGAYPSIGVAGAVTTSISTTDQEFASGDRQQRKGARSVSYSVGPAVSYAVYQGGRVKLVRRQLDIQEEIAVVNTERQVDATVAAVVREYAAIVYRHQQQIATDTALALARTRMFIGQARYESQLAAKTDYLQARSDYAAQQADSLNHLNELAQSFANLNLLMGEPNLDQTWRVDDSLSLEATILPADSTLLSTTPTLRVAAQNLELARLNTRVARTALLPTVDLSAGYTYNRTSSGAGFLLFNQTVGPAAGIGINIPIYEGGNLRRQVRVASLQALQEEIRLARTTTDYARSYRIAWANYSLSVAALRLAEESIGYARENLTIHQARYRVGIGNTLELREAENSYVQALLREFAARYEVKIAETNVLELESRGRF